MNPTPPNKAREFWIAEDSKRTNSFEVDVYTAFGSSFHKNATLHVREILPDELTDTEMLDYMIENHDCINFIDQHDGHGIYNRKVGRVLSFGHNSPREAIRAAMTQEKK